MVALTERTSGLTEIQTLLPPTDEIYVKVTDRYNGTSTASLAVRIRFESSDSDYDLFMNSTQQLLANVTEGVQSNDSAGVLASFKQVALWSASLQTLSQEYTPQNKSLMQE